MGRFHQITIVTDFGVQKLNLLLLSLMIFDDATYVNFAFLNLLYGGTTLLVLLLLVQSMKQVLRDVLETQPRSRRICIASQCFHAVGFHVVFGGAHRRG